MPTVFSSLPGGVPALNWPRHSTGYKLVHGKRYSKLAAVDYAHGGLSLLCYVEATPDGDRYFRGDGWAKRGRPLRTEEWLPFVPLVAAARAMDAGTGPATWCEPYTFEGPEINGGELAVTYRYALGWAPAVVTVLDAGQVVLRYDHLPSGARVDDNTRNVPEDMADVPAADLAETAYVGHRPDGAWEQWPTREHAQAYALGLIEATAAL